MAVKFIILVPLLMTYGICSPFKSPLGYESNSGSINVKEAVTYLNRIKGRTWTAGSNNFDQFLTSAEQRYRLGSLTLDINGDGPSPSNELPINNPAGEKFANEYEEHIYKDDDLPNNYDARTMYPHCTTISAVKDQSRCGCCWAASTAAAFSDRLCIHSKGMINVNISINHIMTCTRAPGVNGCHGGWEHEAWNFLKESGAVSGGDYGTFDGCQPFTIKPCKKLDMPCDPVEKVMTPICRHRKCSNEWYDKPEGEVYKVKSSWRMPGNHTHPNNEIDIRREIYRNGPVTASFKVYWPFYLYDSGIFQLDTSNWRLPNGGHAVRIVGWGVENDTPYWIIANSWGNEWGENGFFRILRGKNHCLIESYINSGIPDIPQDIL